MYFFTIVAMFSVSDLNVWAPLSHCRSCLGMPGLHTTALEQPQFLYSLPCLEVTREANLAVVVAEGLSLVSYDSTPERCRAAIIQCD